MLEALFPLGAIEVYSPEKCDTLRNIKQPLAKILACGKGD
jgi:hypothetical protein